MPRKHLQGDPEIQPDERLISSCTAFLKFVYPVYLLVWCCGVFIFSISSWWVGSALQAIAMTCFGSWIVRAVAAEIRTYVFPLKEVWLGTSGLRVSNYETSIFVAFDAIETIQQRPQFNTGRFVLISLNEDTIFGRSFTFAPINPRLRGWSFREQEDNVIIELRERIAESHRPKIIKERAKSGLLSNRSVMADDELDGPI